MKKNCFRMLNVFSSALMLLAVVSCDNFLNGSELKNKIDEQIVVANAPLKQITVNVINNSCGVIKQEGNYDIKEKVPYNIDFSESADYQFERWIAVRSAVAKTFSSDYLCYTDQFFNSIENDLYPEELVKFVDCKNRNTTVTVYTSNDVVIVPLCRRRPYIKNFSNDNSNIAYDFRGNIKITFDSPIDIDNLLINGKYFLTSRTDLIYPGALLNPGFIKIYEKEFREDNESKDITKNFLASVNNGEDYGELFLVPFDDFTGNISNQYEFIPDNPDIKVPDGFFTDIRDPSCYGMHRGINQRYVEIEVTSDYMNSMGVKSNKVFTKGFVQKLVEDSDAPRISKARYYVPDSRKVYANDVNSYAQDVSNTLYNTNPAYLDKTIVEEIAKEECKAGFNNSFPEGERFYIRRLKNRFMTSHTLIDSSSEDIYPVSDANVKFLTFSLKRVSDSEGNVTANDVNLFEWDQILNSSFKSLDYKNGQVHHLATYKYYSEPHSDYDKTAETLIESYKKQQGMSLDFYLDNTNTPDGLYCIEFYGRDLFGQAGQGSKLFGTAKELNSVGDNKETWIKYKTYNSQFWFVKDTKAPVVSKDEFKIEKNGINNLVIARDEENLIQDFGSNENFKSQYVYRICKVLTPEQKDKWKVNGLEEKGWIVTNYWNYDSDARKGHYDGDYSFNDVWGEDWIPSDIDTGDYHIYSYVKDDINNISDIIDLGRIKDIVPYFYRVEPFTDDDGSAIEFIATNLSNIKKIYYDISDFRGNKLDRMKFVYCNDYYYESESNTKGFTYDMDNQCVVFNSPVSGSYYIYLYPEDIDDNAAYYVTISVEDKDGNRSLNYSTIIGE